jgi:regulator of replication initiation timing
MNKEILEKTRCEVINYLTDSYMLNVIVDVIDNYKELLEEYKQLQQENEELHNKIDKAIEYMKNWNDNWYSYCQQEDKENLIGLLEILKDSDVDE